LPALAGIFVFIPHLIIFYIFVALLEESGYMSRVILLMDKFMRFFGLTGRSAVPLLSNAACGSPALLACLDCSSWRQKLNRIFITPLVNCSNRLPVYIILIALFIPFDTFGGIINLQGLVLLGMYFFSFMAAILSSLVLKLLVKSREEDYLMMELPYFTTPYWKDIWHIVRSSLYGFSLHAVRTVLPISIIFWGLLNFGPAAEQKESMLITSELAAPPDLEPTLILENSYAGQLGMFIEPVIRPLGFDWQIGLAVISSFVAREVFVGSLATIYSQDEAYPTYSIVQRVEAQQNKTASEGPYTLATVLSLLVFYAFAMQFFNLLGRVMKDGKRWWAPLLQMVYMTGLAYISAYSVFQIFS
jgi:ferrous iron transport protein B